MTSPDPEPPVHMLMHARWWANRGIPILPLNYPIEQGGRLVCSCGGDCGSNAAKHPLSALVRNGLNDATTDLDTIDHWWERYPLAGIGGRTGIVFDLLDIDSVEGMRRYTELTDGLKNQPEHLGTAQSGRDGFGMHVYTAPGGLKALQQGKTSPPGIDVKGRGGYAVLPPSRHISGRRYTWLTNTFEDGVLAGAVSWETFYRRLEIRPQVAPRAPRTQITVPVDAADAYGRAVLRRALSLIESSTSGNRWQTLATEAIPLIARGVDGGCIDRDSAVRELEEVARSIGLERREISRIGLLVDDMIAKGIRNPIHPKDAAAKIGDLISSPADLIAPPGARPSFGENATDADSSDGDPDSDTDNEFGDYTGDPRTDPWEPPWPLRYPTPPFPVEVMDWMAPEIVGLADQLQCSVDLVAMMTLAAVAAAVRGRIRAEFVPGWEEPLNLYVATILGPGETKSPALARILEPLYEMEHEAQEGLRDTIIAAQFDRDFAEANAKKLRENALQMRDPQEKMMAQDAAKQALIAAENVVVPAAPTYLAGDMTPEALVAMLAEQGGVLAHLSAEGQLLDTIVGGRYSKGVAQLSGLLTAHDGRESIKVHRRGSADLVVERPCLTIGLAVQPKVLEDLGASDAAMGRGLAARFLFSIPSSLVGRRDMRLRRVGEEFRGFRALIRGVDALAAAGSGQGSGDFGPSIPGKTSSPSGSERWRVSGSPVEGSGDFGPSIPGSSTRYGGSSEAPEHLGFGDFGPSSLKYRFGESSSSLVDQYRHDLEPRRAAETGDLSEVGPWANKLDGQLIRLATVLQLMRDVAPAGSSAPQEALSLGTRAQNPQNPGWVVGVDAVAAARILVDYLIAHAVEAHALMRGAEGGEALTLATQLLGWIRSHGEPEFTAHEAERSLRKRATFRKQGSVRRACETLVRLGWLRLVPPEPGKPGRPSLRFVVHPDAFTSSL